MKRPEYLDLPTSNFSQIFTEFSSKVGADVYVYAHATAPFVEADTIRQGIKQLFPASMIRRFVLKNCKILFGATASR